MILNKEKHALKLNMIMQNVLFKFLPVLALSFSAADCCITEREKEN